MKLGDHTVGLRTITTRVDGGGNPVRDEFGAEVLDAVDVKVEFCLVTPWRVTSRAPQEVESQDRSAPAMTGNTLLAPPGTPVSEDDVVIWPITSETTDGDGNLVLDGRLWQVSGEPGIWDEAVEVRLRAST